jgi:hypothetical protein
VNALICGAGIAGQERRASPGGGAPRFLPFLRATRSEESRRRRASVTGVVNDEEAT